VQPSLRVSSPSVLWLRLALPGIAVAAILAFLAKAVANELAGGIAGLPKLPISPVMCAVVLGMLWRNTLGVPRFATEGLEWVMRGLLRTGIALVGLRLTLSGATAIAVTALPIALTCICVALLGAAAICRLFGVPPRLAVLLAVGTAVCGCTAVIAVAPAIRARNDETAFAITCVVLFGCIAMLTYPSLAALFFSTSPIYAGVFLGTAIHDTTQVIGAGLIYSQQHSAPAALAAASVAKLLRNLSIALLVPAAAWFARGQAFNHSEDGAKLPESRTRVQLVPLFVIGFIFCVVLRTVGDALTRNSGVAADWHALMTAGQGASELFLICGMTAVGLSVSFTQMWRIGWRPLASGLLVAILVGVCSLSLTLATQRLMH
jgi:uncharacterized integral membrane protein (TIGR00698 family)